ncbi:MAG: flavodoxin family protein [Proteobacteria bacterium]|nr:flavodoxin family protein [Pseudomonadota bacterium]
MKVVGINGSPRKKGNTGILINMVFEELETEGITTEFVQLGGKEIKGCRSCYKCFEKKDRRCTVDNDELNPCLEKILEADGIILGSPVYFSGMTAEIKALIDRCGLVGTANGGLFKRKVGASVVAARRAGAVSTFDAINHFFLYGEMFVPGSCYWNVAIGLNPGDVEKDEEGANIMKVLGQNMAWLLKKINN